MMDGWKKWWITLVPVTEGYDAGQLSSELAILADTLEHMQQTADQQRAVLEEEYRHWNTYQQQVRQRVSGGCR